MVALVSKILKEHGFWYQIHVLHFQRVRHSGNFDVLTILIHG